MSEQENRLHDTLEVLAVLIIVVVLAIVGSLFLR